VRDPRRILAVALALLTAVPAARAQAPQRLSLADAVSIASSSSPQVTLALLREREARLRSDQARAAFLPGITGSAYRNDRTFNLLTNGISFPGLPTLVGPVLSYDARLRVTQTLFDGAAWARLGAARTGERVSVAERRGSAEAAAQGAALAYLQLARAQAVLEARVADDTLATRLARLAEQQEAAGASPGIDVVRAHAQQAASRGLRLVAENQRDRARIALARALGVDPMTGFALGDTLGIALARSEAADSAAAALAQAMSRRPELAAERERLARARAERRATAYERLPRLDVAGDWGPSGITAADAIPTRQFTVALTVPVLDGLRREARLAEQSAQVRESEVREADLRSQLHAEVEGALLDIANGEEQVDVAEVRLALAERELLEANERFAQGVTNNIELINAQSSLVRARDALIDARYATAAGRVALARATGSTLTLR
jgi:outer membrane protein